MLISNQTDCGLFKTNTNQVQFSEKRRTVENHPKNGIV